MAMATGLARLRIPVNAEIGYYNSHSALTQGGVGLTNKIENVSVYILNQAYLWGGTYWDLWHLPRYIRLVTIARYPWSNICLPHT